MTTITTHVLDTALGRPAAGVPVVLEGFGGAVTDADGRAALGKVEPGTHRLTFDVAEYFGERDAFYPEVTVTFVVAPGEDHYHVPLLLGPFGYTTYRGS
jgi:5-hydroxyisourate hydrolase